MNRNSPVPLWFVVCVGVVFLGGIYVFGKPSIGVPQVSVASWQPMKAPQVIDQPSYSADSINLTSASSSTLITDEYPMIENQARTIAGYAELRLFTADHQHSQNLYFFTAKKSLPQSLLTIRFSTQTHNIDPTASINSDKDQSFAPVILSTIRLKAWNERKT